MQDPTNNFLIFGSMSSLGSPQPSFDFASVACFSCLEYLMFILISFVCVSCCKRVDQHVRIWNILAWQLSSQLCRLHSPQKYVWKEAKLSSLLPNAASNLAGLYFFNFDSSSHNLVIWILMVALFRQSSQILFRMPYLCCLEDISITLSMLNWNWIETGTCNAPFIQSPQRRSAAVHIVTNKCVFSNFLKTGKVKVPSLRSVGKLFQATGPATEKPRPPRPRRYFNNLIYIASKLFQ